MYVGTFKRYLIYNKGGNKNNCRYFLDDYSPSHNVVVAKTCIRKEEAIFDRHLTSRNFTT